MSVKKFLTWAKQFIKMSSRERNKIKNLVLDQVRSENRKLYNFINSPDIEFVGVAASTEYLLCDGPVDELEALWVHPHGIPSLIFAGKGYMVIVNPILRVSDSVLSEIPGNSIKASFRGLSG